MVDSGLLTRMLRLVPCLMLIMAVGAVLVGSGCGDKPDPDAPPVVKPGSLAPPSDAPGMKKKPGGG